VSFIEGCPAEWTKLPRPPAPLTVGIDGCYVRDWENKKTHFEVIVGKSMCEEAPSRCFGYAQPYDEKPKRRLFELLRSQGMQMNQCVMFFSDGGTDIREVQSYLNPEGEQYLDWFHITMRITVLGQYAEGLDTTPEKREPDAENTGEHETLSVARERGPRTRANPRLTLLSGKRKDRGR